MNETNTRVVGVVLDLATIRALDDAAKRNHDSRSSFVRRAIIQRLEQEHVPARKRT